MEKLTPKQKLFVECYLVSLNATQAAKDAGYKPDNAYQTGNENLKKPKIKKLIDEAIEKRAEKTGVTAERVVTELARIAFGDPTAVVTWGENGVDIVSSDALKPEHLAMVAGVSETVLPQGGIKTEIKFNSKLTALNMLCKHLGMFIDRKEIAANVQHGTKELTKETAEFLKKQVLGIK
jgi:phage terminase small subunit